MNLKTLQSICFCVSLGLMAALASAAPFVSSHGYSMTLPPGWHVGPGMYPEDDAVVSLNTVRGLPAGAKKPGLIIGFLPHQTHATLEVYKQQFISQSQNTFPGLIIVSQAYSTLGGVRDFDITLTKPQNGGRMRVHEVLVLKSGSLYSFMATYPENVHAKYDPIFAQMLASVRWKVQP